VGLTRHHSPITMLRRFSTTAAALAKTKSNSKPGRPARVHKRVPTTNVKTNVDFKFKFTKPSVPAPVQSSTSTRARRTAFRDTDWYTRLQQQNSTDPRFIQRLLERIITYSEQSRLENLSETRQDALLKLVQVYDHIGRGDGDGDDKELELLTGTVRDAIVQCRENNDFTTLLRVYDAYFPTIVDALLTIHSESREELHRDMGDAFVQSDVELNSLERLRNIDASKSMWDREMSGEMEEAVSDLCKEWYALERPRNLRVLYTGLDEIVRLLRDERILMRFGGEFVDDFIKDLLVSDMGLEWADIEVMVRNVLRFQHLDDNLYDTLKGEIIKLNGGMSADLYRVLLEGAIRNSEYKLCERIMTDFAKDGFVLDRTMSHAVLKWLSGSGQEVRAMALLMYMVEEMKLVLFNEDWKVIVDSLVRLGRRDVALDVMKALVIVDNGSGEESESTLTLQDEMRTFDMMNATTKAFSGELLCCRENVTSSVVESVVVTSNNVEEWEQLTGLLEEALGDRARSSELCKIELIVKTQHGVYDGDRSQFAATVERILALPLEQVDRFVQDDECVEAIVAAAGRFMAVVEQEGDDEALAAYGELLQGDASASASREAKAAVLRHILAVAGVGR
jgi:hypothetical protein